MHSLLDSIRRAAIGAACVLGAAAPLVAFQGTNEPGDPARERITRADLEAHVRHLASDEMRGRRTGEPEAVLAARWLANRLETSGVEPGGDAGSHLQRVPMHRVVRGGAPKLVVRTTDGRAQELAYGVDFDQADLSRDARVERFAIVARKEDLPPRPSLEVALVLPESRAQRRALLEAAGTPDGEGWGLIVLLGPDTPGKERESSSTAASLRVDRGPAVGQRLRVRGEAKRRLLAGEFASLTLTANLERTPVEAFNVVGVVRGQGPQADQAIVVSAHYDHLGVDTRPRRPSEPGSESAGTAGGELDLIYNGADDDASGCAIVLELADALVHSPPPERTVIFFFATGEELGLLGTNWYVDHPLVPLEKTVLNLNFEMLGRPDALVGGPGKVWLTGDERTNLGPAFRTRGIAIVADPRPEQNFFERSDNMAFVRKGIVGQSLSTYDLHQDYHRVSDEWDTLDYAHMELCARSSFDALLVVCDDEFVPAWNPGQDFGR